MSERVVVLAVTKMLSGMCTGGISLETNQWVRPVKEFGTVLIGDLRPRWIMAGLTHEWPKCDYA